ELTGTTVAGLDPVVLERQVRECICHFEPRLHRQTLEVRVTHAPEESHHRALEFEIVGEMLANPIPLPLYLKTQIHFENGPAEIVDARCRPPPPGRGPKALDLAQRMDPRLLKYYNRELQHVREMGAEFAEEFPKIAGRLGLEQLECADPYVERLLEGFAFLAARVQLKLDAEFPRFKPHLLEMVYPYYLTPVPSMAVVQFHADPGDGGLAEGFVLPRGTGLRSVLGKDDQTPCEYRTAHDTTLWPIEIVEADYLTRDTAAFEMPKISGARGVKAALRLLFRT